MQEAESKPASITKEGCLHLPPCPCDAISPSVHGSCQGKRNLHHLPRTGNSPPVAHHLLLYGKRTKSCLKPPITTKSLRHEHGHWPPESHSHSESGSPENQKLSKDLMLECLLSDFCRAAHVACCPLAPWSHRLSKDSTTLALRPHSHRRL